jgi:7-carboxy-7-deazaguanine synthase
MPEGIDASILKQSALTVSELCKRYGFRYTPRLHIDLYGNTRGT